MIMKTHLFAFTAASLLAAALLPVTAFSADPVPAAETPQAEDSARLMRKHFADKLPDFVLKNDHGQEVRFVTDLVRDHAVVISFFYTNCRGTCPQTNAMLSQLRPLLARDFGKSIRLISISVEPEADDVEAIHEYAEHFRQPSTSPDMPDWHFLTGRPDEVRSLRRALGYYEVDPKLDNDPTQHAAMVILGNQATGRWAMMPVAFGHERISGKARLIAGWTDGQRYADIRAQLEKNRQQQEQAQQPQTEATPAAGGQVSAATAAITRTPLTP